MGGTAEVGIEPETARLEVGSGTADVSVAPNVKSVYERKLCGCIVWEYESIHCHPVEWKRHTSSGVCRVERTESANDWVSAVV